MEIVKEEEPGYEIYIREDVPLNRSDSKAFEHLGVTGKEDKALKRIKEKRSGCRFENSGFYVPEVL